MRADKRRYGYSRDKRSDCVQVVVALIVTPEGFPLAYEVLPGQHRRQHHVAWLPAEDRGAVRQGARIWVMDRGIPTEDVLAEMRQADPPVSYLVGTPKGRLPDWRRRCSNGLGKAPAKAWTSSFCRKTRSSTCWPEAARASTRSAPCAGAS